MAGQNVASGLNEELRILIKKEFSDKPFRVTDLSPYFAGKKIASGDRLIQTKDISARLSGLKTSGFLHKHEFGVFGLKGPDMEQEQEQPPAPTPKKEAVQTIKAAEAVQAAAEPEPAVEPEKITLTYEDLGKGVYQYNVELHHQIYTLEAKVTKLSNQLEKTKQRIVELNQTIGRQNSVIESQNRAIRRFPSPAPSVEFKKGRGLVKLGEVVRIRKGDNGGNTTK